MAGLYYEEFEVGRKFSHALTRTVTGHDNISFSLMTLNPQPLHVDAHFAGDTLRSRTRIVSKRESRSRGDVGLVEFEHTCTNQDGDVVAICRRVGMRRKREAA